jgi:hypothetical protein
MKDNISDNKWLALGTWYINMWVAYEEESMFLFLHIFVFSLNSSRNEAMGVKCGITSIECWPYFREIHFCLFLLLFFKTKSIFFFSTC